MNPVVWASLQSQDVLVQVDLMLPNLVDEEDLEILEIIRPIKEVVVESNWIQTAIANGGVLTAVGLALVMIPEPVVFAVGFYFGGPVGGYVAIAVVNVIGFGLILLDQVV